MCALSLKKSKKKKKKSKKKRKKKGRERGQPQPNDSVRGGKGRDRALKATDVGIRTQLIQNKKTIDVGSLSQTLMGGKGHLLRLNKM